jgi:hypothetical protein
VQAQVICSFIGAQAQVEHKGGRNPLVDAALKISFLGKADEELDRMRGERVADRIEDDPRFQRVAADPDKGIEAANGAGSFEALMAGWGASTSGAPALAVPEPGEGGGE